MEESLDDLVSNLENPTRIELAEKVRADQRIYARAFEDVHDVITSRNDIIRNQLDRIGPKVADRVEELKLAIKADQDELGPRAEAEIDQAVAIASTTTLASVALGALAAWFIGFGVSRPIRKMSDTMRELAAGNLDVEIPMSGRRDEIGEMAAAVGIFKQSMIEIHRLSEEQRRTAVQLSEAKEAADSASQAKSAFLASMSHELRTPMNAILGYSEMLMEEAEDQGQDDFVPDLKRINEAGTHLLTLINDVLDLSKVESGKMEAFAEAIDLGALVDQVVGTAQPLMEKNGNELRVEREPQLGSAHQDLTKLRQSLLNLLSNAAKFTRSGTITLRARRELRGGADWLTFAVSDTGIGIPPDKLVQVFEEFGQAEDSTSREYGGTGLGLPLSRRFCQLLGGDLTLESRVGQGSTFTIRVPATLPGTAMEAAQQQLAKGETEAGVTRKGDAGPTVLVIDDDPEARDIIERLLRKDGVAVVTAGGGEEGLRLAREIRPAVITLDVVMPDMDGWSVLRALKADPELREIPVVMLTMIDDKSRSYALGATDYLTKPVDRQRLQDALARYYASDESGPVLLVEDDVAARGMAARTLEKLGCETIEAGNGREALDRLAEVKPGLVLLDLMMPVMDGFEFLLEMRANPDWQDVPVIVLTGKDLTSEDRRALSGRVEQIVEKGAGSNEEVASLVHGLIRKGGSASA
jgi:signal transduction histidine kinase/DNA-binding response OmpR family regulator